MSQPPDLPPVIDTEAAEADVQEQAEPVADTDATTGGELPRTDSVEVDEADAAEQGRAVELDPDEYR